MSVSVMAWNNIRSPLMIFYAVALIFFGQAAITFMLSKPWSHLWWLAHVIFAAGFTILSWGVVQALLTTRSFATAYSQDELMRALEHEKNHANAANHQLQMSQVQLQAVLNGVQDCVITIDKFDVVKSFNASAEHTFGYQSNEVIGCNIKMLVPEPYQSELDGYLHQYDETQERKVIGQGREFTGLRKNGSTFPIELSINESFVNGEPMFTASVRDITKIKWALEQLRIAATAFELQEGMMVTDDKAVIIRVNKAFTTITGYNAEDVIGHSPKILSSGRHQDAIVYEEVWQQVNTIGYWAGEIWNKRKNGDIYPENLTISAVTNDEGIVTNYVGMLSDITLRKQAEQEIKDLAYYDPLTDLPNRRLMLDRINHAMAVSARSGKECALLFLDLDNFKTLNDTLGHDMGDLLLRQVAERLKGCIREGDTVSRFGGDEYVVLLEGLSAQAIEAACQVDDIGNKILSSINSPYQLASNSYTISTSIGIALFNGHQCKTNELLKQADIALYQSKEDGRNALCFFDPHMQEKITARAVLESELHQVIEQQQQFQLYYQIQVDDSGHPLGAEALIRWVHPERGLISPIDFIPLAEQNGTILAIGLWVLDTACGQLKAWQQDLLTQELTLSVNVSAKQFRQADFISQVMMTTQQHAINPARLKLELTETLLINDIKDTIAKMTTLSEIGIQFSLDDFGTGYSSLQYLKKLPFYQLKIDKSFVDDLVTDSDDQAIVRTIIAMADSLGMNVIAEGVETKEQQQRLLVEGCTQYQGYLYSKPLPIDEFEALLIQADC
ncbi:MAG: EAL domain-containing protein [Colwellia sp.]|nr:EAL domain-containing protein [Colwellia sp.]